MEFMQSWGFMGAMAALLVALIGVMIFLKKKQG